jgi:hypothetical protein
MAHIRLDDKRIELSAGELRIETGDEAQVGLDAGPEKGTLAIIIVDPSGTATVRRVSAGATILVNGVALGAEPAPLLHGDRIEVAGRQLRFSDDRKAGSTVLMPALGAAIADGECPTVGEGNAVRSKETPTLATLEVVNEGASKGSVYRIRAPLAHIGRAEHNDVIVADDSGSDSHGRTQRRASGWFVVGMDSTNGTYVSADRVRGERALNANTAVRFGGVKVIFRSEPEIVDADGETRMIVGFKPSDQQGAPEARRIVANRQADGGDTARATRVSPLVWITAAVAIGATVLLVIQDR